MNKWYRRGPLTQGALDETQSNYLQDYKDLVYCKDVSTYLGEWNSTCTGMFITEEKEKVRTADVAENFGSSSKGAYERLPNHQICFFAFSYRTREN